MKLSEFVKQWNNQHTSVKVQIATTGELFREFERRSSDVLPSVRGDFTPYWEDGVASSARETALNRAAAERLVQTETLCSMLNPNSYPEQKFYTAWRNVLLYDEHTWGAQSYVRYPPGSEGYDAQWKIKQAFALDAYAPNHLAERPDGEKVVSNHRPDWYGGKKIITLRQSRSDCDSAHHSD